MTHSPNLFPAAGATLVIGGSGGIGSAIVRKFAANGSPVAFTYSSSSDRSEGLAAELRAGSAHAHAYHLDLTNPPTIKQAVDAALAEFGAIHTVVHAAGAVLHLRYISKIDPDRMKYHLDSDVMGLFAVMQATLPLLRDTRGSYVICASCGVSRWPIKDALSVVPKAAMLALAQGIAREEGRFGIRANVIGTGVIDAGVTHIAQQSGDLPQSFIDGTISSTPLGRIGDADDIAEAALYFASSRAKFVTGQLLNVDGGWSV